MANAHRALIKSVLGRKTKGRQSDKEEEFVDPLPLKLQTTVVSTRQLGVRKGPGERQEYFQTIMQLVCNEAKFLCAVSHNEKRSIELLCALSY